MALNVLWELLLILYVPEDSISGELFTSSDTVPDRHMMDLEKRHNTTFPSSMQLEFHT